MQSILYETFISIYYLKNNPKYLDEQAYEKIKQWADSLYFHTFFYTTVQKFGDGKMF